MHTTDDYRDRAAELLKLDVGDHFQGGAGDEATVLANEGAVQHVRLKERCLGGVSNRAGEVQTA
jgi:hypothetical protein